MAPKERRMTDWAWLTRLPTRQRVIVDLLDNYQDVLNGLRDMAYNHDTGDWGYVHAMCEAWNRPSEGYPELERLRILMRDTEPRLYWHVAERWIRPERRRAHVCDRCGSEGKEWVHRHGRDTVARVWRSVPRISPAVSPAQCEHGITWLAEHWHGEPFLPDVLLHLAA